MDLLYVLDLPGLLSFHLCSVVVELADSQVELPNIVLQYFYPLVLGRVSTVGLLQLLLPAGQFLVQLSFLLRMAGGRVLPLLPLLLLL